MLFDKNGVIRRYESPEAILSEFFELRMEFYSRRRLLLIQVLHQSCLVMHILCSLKAVKLSAQVTLCSAWLSMMEQSLAPTAASNLNETSSSALIAS